MKIGIIITRIGGVDGVALETEKWWQVLKKMGHEVYFLTGKLERSLPEVTILPELYLYHPFNEEEQNKAFFHQNTQNRTIRKLLDEHTNYLERNILRWIVSKRIDCIVSQNASALPCHLSMGMAIARIIQSTGISAVLHHHDFYWERGERYESKYPYVKEVLETCFPPLLPTCQHVVINSYNQERLKERFSIEATYVPNVMDFDSSFAKKDSFNKDFRTVFRLTEKDILLGQITRIVRRKGIETAIELLAKLQDKNCKIIVTGSAQDEPSGYLEELVSLVKKKRLTKQVIFADKTVDHFRQQEGRKKVYSLSDVYAYVNSCTYFSTYEGFGNAFVEAVLAKRPIFVNNYKPVYWPDIGSLGFQTVMLEENCWTKKKVEDVKEVIYNPQKARKIAKTNFQLGKKHFSFTVLERKLGELFPPITIG
jgi:glycosyltransferase involved in cell wall biosynthesis